VDRSSARTKQKTVEAIKAERKWTLERSSLKMLRFRTKFDYSKSVTSLLFLLLRPLAQRNPAGSTSLSYRLPAEGIHSCSTCPHGAAVAGRCAPFARCPPGMIASRQGRFPCGLCLRARKCPSTTTRFRLSQRTQRSQRWLRSATTSALSVRSVADVSLYY
jgi:hypothetical protein